MYRKRRKRILCLWHTYYTLEAGQTLLWSPHKWTVRMRHSSGSPSSSLKPYIFVRPAMSNLVLTMTAPDLRFPIRDRRTAAYRFELMEFEWNYSISDHKLHWKSQLLTAYSKQLLWGERRATNVKAVFLHHAPGHSWQAVFSTHHREPIKYESAYAQIRALRARSQAPVASSASSSDAREMPVRRYRRCVTTT